MKKLERPTRLLDILMGGRRAEREGQPARVHRRAPNRTSPLSRKVLRFLNLAGEERLTPYGKKELTRRRAANKVAKQARKVNRRYRATGGKK